MSLTKEGKRRIENVIDRVFGGLHNAPKIHWRSHYAEVNARSSQLATFDADRLTRLVFACHDQCVRAEFNNGGPSRVKVRLSPRNRIGRHYYERHPTLDEAVASWCLQNVDEVKT